MMISDSGLLFLGHPVYVVTCDVDVDHVSPTTEKPVTTTRLAPPTTMMTSSPHHHHPRRDDDIVASEKESKHHESEHERFVRAKTELEKRHHEKVNKVRRNAEFKHKKLKRTN